MKHLLSIEQLSAIEIDQILSLSSELKKARGSANSPKPLAGQTWALMFSKSSTRTRVSFEVGIRELGGSPMFLSATDIQLGRGEPIRDTARVLGRFVNGAIIRTFAQQDVVEFAQFSGIPTINALTDDEHPCQILADIQTYQEKRGSIRGKVVVFIGDAACNVPTSWIFAAAKLGFELRLAAPKKYQPSADLVKRAGGKITVTEDLRGACAGADLLYTDVWVSMGKEAEAAERIRELGGYQINEAIIRLAKPDALVMHCLPAYREKEITESAFEAHAQTIFDEAENRLHAQKAIMALLAQNQKSTGS
jgi:ornithine carbamoyltransferase